jgi:hypothetical protein
MSPGTIKLRNIDRLVFVPVLGALVGVAARSFTPRAARDGIPGSDQSIQYQVGAQRATCDTDLEVACYRFTDTWIRAMMLNEVEYEEAEV